MTAWTLHVSGLAPHADTTLTIPDGAATIRGASGAGKSTLTEAVLLALTGAGSDREPSTAATIATPIHPGRITSVARVALTTPSGGVLTWQCAAGGRPSRTLRRASGQVLSDDGEIRAALGAAGDRDLVTAIVAPRWMLDRLALPPAASQAMRDVLSRALVGDRLDAYLSAHLRDGEPRERKRAEKAATDARRAADTAAGVLQGMAGDPDPELASVDPDRVAEARAAHAAHAAALQRYHAEMGRIGAADAAYAAAMADQRAAALLGQVPCRGRMLADDAADVDCSTCPLLADAQAARDRLPGTMPEPVTRPVQPVLAPWVGEVLQAATRADAAREAWAARQATRAARLEAARASAEATAAAAARATEVQRIVREAPGIVLDEVIRTLADRSGLAITASPTSVSVAWRGIPWGSLSSGQRVVADAAFREGLRDMCDLGWLPLFVDDAQLATGAGLSLPGDDAGPVWTIRGAAPGEPDAIRVEVSDGG